MDNVKKPTQSGSQSGSVTKTLGNYCFIFIFLCILIAYLIINGGATTWNGVMNILRHSTIVGTIAFGMGLVIITGGIDLSVGSTIALVGGLSVTVFNSTNNMWLTLLFAIAAGALLSFTSPAIFNESCTAWMCLQITFLV